MKEKIWETKLGKFNICLDIKNIGFGIELDFDEPISFDVVLPFIKLGWQMPYEDDIEFTSPFDDPKLQWLADVYRVQCGEKLLFDIRDKNKNK